GTAPTKRALPTTDSSTLQLQQATLRRAATNAVRTDSAVLVGASRCHCRRCSCRRCPCRRCSCRRCPCRRCFVFSRMAPRFPFSVALALALALALAPPPAPSPAAAQSGAARPRAASLAHALTDTLRVLLDRAVADSAFPGAFAVVGDHQGVIASYGA